MYLAAIAWQTSSTQDHFIYNYFLVLDILFQIALQILPGRLNQSHIIIMIKIRNLKIVSQYFELSVTKQTIFNVVMPRKFSCSPKPDCA